MMDKIISNYIKYKFIFNKDINHSSYLYQKVFRSLYGYQQNVTKKNKKVYTYTRKGLLSDIPHLKPGKNSFIIPLNYENLIINYFKTGENPAHLWKNKGDWKVEYIIEKLEVDLESVIECLENFLSNYNIINLDNKSSLLLTELDYIIRTNNNNKDYIKYILKECNKITNFNWFKEVYKKSDLLSSFYEKYNSLVN
ncbi:MAG: hypothetical protein PHR26_00985 [Candidatus ainarchaeum sp.]|nr:hypothetical protein [Candidatus ainarchaeum sp.]MDD3975858.1 hypothetical protein [Candidatus ainarchaeum sp.]